MLVVLCPTRGRPEAALAAYQSFLDTRAQLDTQLVFVVDEDDPSLPEYRSSALPPFIQVDKAAGGNMVKALNVAALGVARNWNPDAIGFIGDDHRFRSSAWDSKIMDALASAGGGFAFGDDMAWHGRLATQVFISTKIIKALGWMGLPTCKHLYIDNAWMQLGQGIKRLIYLPDVIIEHIHPAFGKAEWDEGHKRVNTQEMYGHDGLAFESWMTKGGFEADLDRVISVL